MRPASTPKEPREKTATIAVAGNPNTGKTTLFNGLTGSTQHVGNWPGVTVEKREGSLNLASIGDFLASPFLPAEEHTRAAVPGSAAAGGKVTVVDLPGIYALSASSEDEVVARDYILSGEPDLVVDVVDASNLQRNLYLTLQLIEMRVPVLVVLNMADVAEKRGIRFDPEHLAEHLGCPVIAVSAVRQEGIRAVREAIARALSQPRVSPARVHYPDAVERLVEQWSAALRPVASGFHADERWAALKLLEGDPLVTDRVIGLGALEEDRLAEAVQSLETELGEEPDIVLADARYGFIHGLTRHVVRKKVDRRSLTDRVDRVVMNRFLGVPIFLAVMYAVFWVTISVGGAFIDFFDIAFGAIFVDGFGALLATFGAPPWLIGILAGGVGAGIQTVATFIPIIFMMFLMLSLLEDSGYMARAAFVMDRVMRWIGLPGRSFVPMMVGFGCTVPAIMGTRTLESAKDRYMTNFMVPFMSCGARLPVYALFAAALFPAFAGGVVFSLYVLGIVLAMLTGLLLKHTLFRGEVSHFVMELPPYHTPRPLHVLRHVWSRLRLFVVRAGVTITIVVTVLSFANSLGTDGTLGNEDSPTSVLASVGRTITPVFEPMGVAKENWPATVGLFTGLFAKEAVVGTLASLYTQNEMGSEAEAGETEGEEEQFRLGPPLAEALATIPENLSGVLGGLADPIGAGIISGGDEAAVGEELETDAVVFARMRESFSPLGAYTYLLFVLIYFPCVAALGAAVREMGAGYGWLLAGYLTVLAWCVATLVYQIGAGAQPVFVALPLVLMAAMVVLFRILGRNRRWT